MSGLLHGGGRGGDRPGKTARVQAYGARRRALKTVGALAVVLSLLGGLPGAAQAKTTIIAFGDSLTEGFGLMPGEGLVPQLRAWLKAHGHDVDIVNAGVSGDTTAGGLSRIGWTLATPADAVIVELGGNDLLRGLSPATTRANLDGILKAIKAKGLPVLLIGVRAPANYGADFQKTFDAIYPDLAKKYGALLVPDYFSALDHMQDRAKAMAQYMQGDGIHPNAAGVKRIVARLGPEVEKLLTRAK